MKCIIPSAIRELRNAITEKGGFSALRNMTAQERVDFFKKYVDMPGSSDTAEWLNREIEKRILQPAQIAATKEWLKNLEKKKAKISNQDALLDRIMKKKEVFNPRSFYAEGLAKQALGFETSREDAKKLYDFSVSINEYKKNLLALDPEYLNRKTDELKDLPENVRQAREELGKKLVEFQKEYEAINLKAQMIDYANKNLAGKAWEKALQVAGNIKSLKASFDVSFLRQLQSVFVSGQRQSFYDAMKTGYKVFFGKDINWADTVMAELLTRPNALANRYNDFGVEVGIKEEAFPESWVSQAIGERQLNIFRRSEAAFNTAIQTARADLFDWMWEQSNGDIKLLREQDVGKAINILTGRGAVPVLTPKDPETQRIINNLLFAPKWLASRIQTLTDLRFVVSSGNRITVDGKSVLTPQGLRAKAAIGNVIMIAIAAATRRLLWGLDAEEGTDYGTILDPRSTDFGKVIIGRTRFDLTAGTASLITLVARLSLMETMTAQGRVRPARPADLLFNFISGKASPGIQLAANIQHAIRTGGEFVDWRGKPLKWDTTADWAENLADWFAPIVLTGGIVESAIAPFKGEELDTAYWGEVIGIVADFVGVGANTYDKK